MFYDFSEVVFGLLSWLLALEFDSFDHIITYGIEIEFAIILISLIEVYFLFGIDCVFDWILMLLSWLLALKLKLKRFLW